MIWVLVGLVVLLGLVALRDAIQGDRHQREEEEDAMRWWRERQEAARKAAREQAKKAAPGDGRNW